MLVPMRMERDGFQPGGGGRSAAGKHPWPGTGPTLRGAGRFCPGADRMEIPERWRLPRVAGIECGVLRFVDQRQKEDWLALAGDNTNLRIALEELYKQFKDAPVLGSLINPEASLGKGSLFEMKWEDVGPLLTKALAEEKDDVKNEMGVVASGIAKASLLMIKGYDLLITNVPYLVRGKHNDEIKNILKLIFPTASIDLAYGFLIRCLQYLNESGNASVVLPENWLYINPCQNFRKRLIDKYELNSINRLGPGAFQTISGEVVKGLLVSICNKNHSQGISFLGLTHGQHKGLTTKLNLSFMIGCYGLVKLTKRKIRIPESVLPRLTAALCFQNSQKAFMARYI